MGREGRKEEEIIKEEIGCEGMRGGKIRGRGKEKEILREEEREEGERRGDKMG